MTKRKKQKRYSYQRQLKKMKDKELISFKNRSEHAIAYLGNIIPDFSIPLLGKAFEKLHKMSKYAQREIKRREKVKIVQIKKQKQIRTQKLKQQNIKVYKLAKFYASKLMKKYGFKRAKRFKACDLYFLIEMQKLNP